MLSNLIAYQDHSDLQLQSLFDVLCRIRPNDVSAIGGNPPSATVPRLPKTQGFHQTTIPYLTCLHNYPSNSPASSPFGTMPLAVFHLVEAPKFLCLVGFSIKFFTFRLSGPSSPSQKSHDPCPLCTKMLARAWSP